MKRNARSEGWVVEKLGKVIQKTETVNPLQTPNKQFFYIDISSVNNKSLSVEEATLIAGKDAPSRARKLICAGDVIFATVRPTLNRIAVISEKYDHQVCSTGYFVLRGKEFIYNKFLFYYLQTRNFYEKMEKLQKGASYPAVTDNEVKEQIISYPSFSEQQRIVALLDKAFEEIDEVKKRTHQNVVNARALYESYQDDVFVNHDKSWTTKALGDVCVFQGGSQPPKSAFSKINEDGYVRLIQIRDYKSDKFAVYINKNIARRFCSADDVMIGRYGPPVFQILRGLEGAYNVALMKAIPNENELTKDFLYFFLKHKQIQNYIIRLSTRAAGQSGLNKETIEPYPISYPDISKQKFITERLSKLLEMTKLLEIQYKQKLTTLENLKQSILAKAFSGEL